MVSKKGTIRNSVSIKMFVLAVIFLIGVLENEVHCRGLPDDFKALLEILETSVQHVQTGYLNEPIIRIPASVLNWQGLQFPMKKKFERITCSYYYSVIKHLKLSQRLFGTQMSALDFDLLLIFKPIMSLMICSVSEHGGMTVPGLWMFKKYMDELNGYISTMRENNQYQEGMNKIAEINDRLATQLPTYTARCKLDDYVTNLFEITKEEERSTDFKNLIGMNYNAILAFINENVKRGLTVKNLGKYSMNHLYFGDMANNCRLSDVLEKFDLGVNWCCFIDQLKQKLAEAHDFTKISLPDRDPVLEYHKSVFDFVYLVVLRLTRRSLPNNESHCKSCVPHIFLPHGHKNHDKVQPLAQALQTFVDLLDQRYGGFLRKIQSELAKCQECYDHVGDSIKTAEDEIKRKYCLTFSDVHIKDRCRRNVLEEVEVITKRLDLGDNRSEPDGNARTMLVFYQYIINVLFEDIDFYVVDSIYETSKRKEEYFDYCLTCN